MVPDWVLFFSDDDEAPPPRDPVVVVLLDRVLAARNALFPTPDSAEGGSAPDPMLSHELNAAFRAALTHGIPIEAIANHAGFVLSALQRYLDGEQPLVEGGSFFERS
jgi:hypothetical protein